MLDSRGKSSDPFVLCTQAMKPAVDPRTRKTYKIFQGVISMAAIDERAHHEFIESENGEGLNGEVFDGDRLECLPRLLLAWRLRNA